MNHTKLYCSESGTTDVLVLKRDQIKLFYIRLVRPSNYMTMSAFFRNPNYYLHICTQI